MFVGSDRVGVVDSLLGVFERVVGGGGAGLVVLSAPTGYGKTRTPLVISVGVYRLCERVVAC